METIIHRADERGYAHHGWLDAHHSFSFASYHDPKKIHFGALRVLNDDVIAAGKGFDTHPHENMEIITIPLSGALAHKDSMGNGSTIQAGEIQLMSAGTGIFHSEFNPLIDQDTNLLQLWIFPDKKAVTPRYQQFQINSEKNRLQQIVSPNESDTSAWIHQNAWLSLGTFEKDQECRYKINAKDNGVYVFLISGQAIIAGTTLNKRDAIGISKAEEISILVEQNDTQILLIDVPMHFSTK